MQSVKQVGIWIIGAYGSVAAAAVAGAKGRTRGLVGTTGLLTEIDDFQDIGFLPFEQMVFGGHEVREGSLRGTFAQLSAAAHLEHDVAVE
jgi:myo-inositol-1-phosphate synthase